MPYDPTAMFKSLFAQQPDPSEALQRRAQEYQQTGVDPGAKAATSNEDILRSILMGSGGGSTMGRPDPIGGVNHQGRALETFKQMMASSAGAAGGGGGGGGK